MKLIKLTTKDGAPIYLNAEQLTAFVPTKNDRCANAVVYLTDGEGWLVTETTKEIAALIESSRGAA